MSESPSSSTELLNSSSPSSRTVEVPCRSSGPDFEVPVHGRLLHVNIVNEVGKKGSLVMLSTHTILVLKLLFANHTFSSV